MYRPYYRNSINRWSLSKDTQISILEIAVAALIGILVCVLMKPKIISPLSDNPVVETIYAADLPSNQKSTIVGYIYEVFSKSGHEVAMRAINCFKSESGLNTFAVHINKDGSQDKGVAQINSYYHGDMTDPFNYKKSVDYAYQLYKSRGNFSAWYGTGCR